MLEALKEAVYQANLELPRRKLVTLTWGNVSGIDRERGLFVIKPSGVAYEALRAKDLAVIDLRGEQVEGTLAPSSDTKTHLALYNAFPEIGGIAHAHSPWAASWAQAGEDLAAYGTTHADYFYGAVPCVRPLTEEELADYEYNTGLVIVEEFRRRGLDPAAIPAALCYGHGPFAWGKDAAEAVENAAVLEEAARMAAYTRLIRRDAPPLPERYLNKHYLRKHGPDAYYGQGNLRPSGGSAATERPAAKEGT